MFSLDWIFSVFEFAAVIRETAIHLLSPALSFHSQIEKIYT